MADKKKPPYTAPTPQEVDKHWKAQETSVFRKPHTRDPGLSILNSKDEARAIIAAEIEQGPQPVFKLRSSAQDIPDPLANAQRTVRAARAREADVVDVMLDECRSIEEVQLVNAFMGEMPADKRGVLLAKIADGIFRKQQEALKQHHLARKEEERRTEQMLAAQRLLAKRKPKEADGA